jgi:hypothetical protein
VQSKKVDLIITRIYRELKKLNSQRINDPMKKWANELNRAFSKEEMQIARKLVKKCSTSLSVKEMQIKTTLSFNLTPVRMATIKNSKECKLVQPLWKTLWRLLKKLNIDLPYDPATPLLGIYPKKCNSGYYKSTCTPMFIAALFTIAKLWKQPRCTTTDEWIKKIWYSYIMEFYLTTKKNEILLFTSKWMELENITLSEVSQAQKAKNCRFSLICEL